MFQHQVSFAWIFHDFVSGENLDEVALLARVEGLSNSDACRRLLDLAGFGDRRSRVIQRPPQAAADSGKVPQMAVTGGKPRRRPFLGELKDFSMSDVQALADLRGLDCFAIQLAAQEGLLFRAEHRGVLSWVVTDSSRWNARFRRMDGLLFETKGGVMVKSLSPIGRDGDCRCWNGWPIGFQSMLDHFRELNCILFTEGEPDLLAGFQVMIEAGFLSIATVMCLPSSSLSISDELLPLFKGKRVRLFPHVDKKEAGMRAALKWHLQLSEAGAIVDAFDLSGLLCADGKPVKDLNDVCLMDCGEREALNLMEGMLP